MGLLAELRRRNVIRMAGLYLVGAWLCVQVAETLLPIFDTPGWVLKALVTLLAIGFVPALVFSWIFELTPEGLKRESEVDRSESIVDHTARRLDLTVIVLLLCVGGLMLWRQFSPPSAVEAVAAEPGQATPAEQPATAAVTDKSIAVLPFADFSPGGDQAWFADGLSEEILNSLARTPDLQVTARTSSFRYKGSELAIPQIAAELGVAYVLEGSVRSTSERIRVTAQLIRAADGFHLWSQNYDRDVADMIAIQEDLAEQIAIAMQTSMDPEALAAMARAGTRSVEAYQAYLRGLAAQFDQDPTASYTTAYDAFELARRLDPGFADAHAQAALYWLRSIDPTFNYVFDPRDQVAEAVKSARFIERIDLAIRTTPNEVDRLGYEAMKAAHGLRLRDAIGLYRRGLEGRPGDLTGWSESLQLTAVVRDYAQLRELLDAIWPKTATSLDYAGLYLNYMYRTDTRLAADNALVLLERWPGREPLMYQAHRTLLWDGRVEEAGKVLAAWSAIVTPNRWSALPPARQACAEGRRADAERLLAEAPPDDHTLRWHVLELLGRSREAGEQLQVYEASGHTNALAGFLGYPHFDPAPFPSLMAMMEREGIAYTPPKPLPFACPPETPAP